MTTQVRSHNDVHELTAIDSNPLSYDPKGNLTANTHGHAYTWDFDNMQATATVPASPTQGIAGTHTYQYDALGRRVAKVVNDATDSMNVVTTKTLYINSYELLPPLGTVGGQVLAEYEKVGTGNVTLARTYCYGEYVDEPLTLIDYTDLGSVSAGDPEPFYYHHNRVFHVIGLTDESDDVVELYAYTPYGQVETLAPSLNPRSESTYGNCYLFTGRYLDHETRLFYFRARYFESGLGRFIGRDPAGLLLTPTYMYSYASSRPLVTMDPSGLQPEAWCTLNGIDIVPCERPFLPPPLPPPGGTSTTRPNIPTDTGSSCWFCERPPTVGSRSTPNPNPGQEPRPRPVGPVHGHQYSGPQASAVGAAGAHGCAIVVMRCNGGHAVFHFGAEDSPGGTIDGHTDWSDCEAIVCGGDDSDRQSRCLHARVHETLQRRNVPVIATLGGQGCGFNPDGTIYVVP